MNHAESLARQAFPSRRVGYSGEDFDAAQRIAVELTDRDRREGRAAPAAGYSADNYAAARAAVREWLQP